MKRLFCIVVSVLILTSCTKQPLVTSSDASSVDTSFNVSTIEDVSSEEVSSEVVSEDVSSQEEIFEFSIDAKTMVEKVKEEISLNSDTVSLDKRFIFEKTGISDDMYDDFYAEMSYEVAKNDFVVVFCCNTAKKVDNLKQKLSEALGDETKLFDLSNDASIVSENGYILLIATQNNYNEENLVSKLIQ